MPARHGRRQSRRSRVGGDRPSQYELEERLRLKERQDPGAEPPGPSASEIRWRDEIDRVPEPRCASRFGARANIVITTKKANRVPIPLAIAPSRVIGGGPARTRNAVSRIMALWTLTDPYQRS